MTRRLNFYVLITAVGMILLSLVAACALVLYRVDRYRKCEARGGEFSLWEYDMCRISCEVCHG